MWDPMFNDGPAPWPDQYKAVAKVDTDDLDHAWQQTNHIDHSWTDNTDVETQGDGPFRSSMVGDVFEKDGVYYMVVAMGFEALP